MKHRSYGIVLLGSLIGVSGIAAQTCVGAASFADGRARIGAAGTIGDRQKSFGGGVGVGVPKSVFGAAAVSLVNFDDIDENATVFAVQGGYQIQLPSAATVQLCPIIGHAHQAGPNNAGGTNLDVSGDAFSFGASIGIIASHSATFDFVPAARLHYVTTKSHATGDFFGIPVDESQSADYGVFNLFGGLIINRVVAIVPSAALPFGRSDVKPEYSLTLSFSFGHR